MDGKPNYNLCHGMQLKDCRQKCPIVISGVFHFFSEVAEFLHVTQHSKENACSIIILIITLKNSAGHWYI